MTPYTVDELTALLDKHGIEYCDVHDSDPNYFRVEFDKGKQIVRPVFFDKQDLIAIGQAEKLLNETGRFGILEHIRLLTDSVFDHEKQEWR